MGIRLSEHRSCYLYLAKEEKLAFKDKQAVYLNSSKFEKLKDVSSKAFNKSSYRFLFNRVEDGYEVKADYCVGIDWIGKTGKYVYVEPKVNTFYTRLFSKQLDNEETEIFLDNFVFELDYLKMLFKVTSLSDSNTFVKDLVQIDWDNEHIPIQQKEDRLTPFLIVRFLQSIKLIVRKGLKKNYYKVQENLNNRIKGKILLGNHIKENLYKNRFTSTICEYQVFGEDTIENRFLKRVLFFVSSYVQNNKVLFGDILKSIQETINFCKPAFLHISEEYDDFELNNLKKNIFFNDYNDATLSGKRILKSFAFNITNTAIQKVSTPPFWIDMPRLFELYIYSKIVEANIQDKSEIHYQFSTLGNTLDILVSKIGFQMIIDAKYKLHYNSGHIHEDIRQVAGYARLNKVRNKLKIYDNSNIDCLIIYPDLINGIEDFKFSTIMSQREPLKAYHKIYKLGVKLPFIGGKHLDFI